jgi:hypothetical protein
MPSGLLLPIFIYVRVVVTDTQHDFLAQHAAISVCGRQVHKSEAGCYLAIPQASVTHISEADLQYVASSHSTLSYLKNQHTRLREEKMHHRSPFRSVRPVTQSFLSRVSLVVVVLLSLECSYCTTTIIISAAIFTKEDNNNGLVPRSKGS